MNPEFEIARLQRMKSEDIEKELARAWERMRRNYPEIAKVLEERVKKAESGK